MQVVDCELLAVDGLERELLQRLLLENLLVHVGIDLEALEALVWDDVRNLVEYLIHSLTAACIKATSFFVFADFNVGDVLVVGGLERFVPELVCVPLVPPQLNLVIVQLDHTCLD